jgi:metal-responsive CopG/Arc/MetJ family transcriptional regulator
MARKSKEDEKQSELVTVRMPASLLEQLDRWMAKHPGDLNRSQSVRWMCQQYLQSQRI